MQSTILKESIKKRSFFSKHYTITQYRLCPETVTADEVNQECLKIISEKLNVNVFNLYFISDKKGIELLENKIPKGSTEDPALQYLKAYCEYDKNRKKGKIQIITGGRTAISFPI